VGPIGGDVEVGAAAQLHELEVPGTGEGTHEDPQQQAQKQRQREDEYRQDPQVVARARRRDDAAYGRLDLLEPLLRLHAEDELLQQQAVVVEEARQGLRHGRRLRPVGRLHQRAKNGLVVLRDIGQRRDVPARDQ
jgi:hypothetical protein